MSLSRRNLVLDDRPPTSSLLEPMLAIYLTANFREAIGAQ